MESPKRPANAKRTWFQFSEKIPDEEVVVAVQTPGGIAFPVRPGEMTPELLQALNESFDHLVHIGLLRVGDDGDERPRRE
ncbi:MAG: hypothetical protein HOV70_01645 [Streptomyces sp.]|nr:hypothetical protein [Streptomyces sp.]